jgi:hypothetical protein
MERGRAITPTTRPARTSCRREWVEARENVIGLTVEILALF